MSSVDQHLRNLLLSVQLLRKLLHRFGVRIGTTVDLQASLRVLALHASLVPATCTLESFASNRTVELITTTFAS